MPLCDSCNQDQCTAATQKPGESKEAYRKRQKLESRLCRVKHKIVVLSGKGGVGESTIAVNLAVGLKAMGLKTGLLDVDIHGPSVPTMLGLENKALIGTKNGLVPLDVNGLKVISAGFFLKSQDDAVIWRGPMKANVIRQFLQDVMWGELDLLVIDSPPGTGDEPLSVCQLIKNLDGAVIVTTPQKVAAVDVRKSITFCRQLKVPVLGIIENMSGFACPKCKEISPIFGSGGGQRIAVDMGVPFLGAIPIDPRVAAAGDMGQVPIELDGSAAAAQSMRTILEVVSKHSIGPKKAVSGLRQVGAIRKPAAGGGGGGISDDSR
jgi:Mrp family chromosome partitioning ATPase